MSVALVNAAGKPKSAMSAKTNRAISAQPIAQPFKHLWSKHDFCGGWRWGGGEVGRWGGGTQSAPKACGCIGWRRHCPFGQRERSFAHGSRFATGRLPLGARPISTQIEENVRNTVPYAEQKQRNHHTRGRNEQINKQTHQPTSKQTTTPTNTQQHTTNKIC